MTKLPNDLARVPDTHAHYKKLIVDSRHVWGSLT